MRVNKLNIFTKRLIVAVICMSLLAPTPLGAASKIQRGKSSKMKRTQRITPKFNAVAKRPGIRNKTTTRIRQGQMKPKGKFRSQTQIAVRRNGSIQKHARTRTLRQNFRSRAVNHPSARIRNSFSKATNNGPQFKQRLRNRFKDAHNKYDSRIPVIGHYPQYKLLANKLEARRFYIRDNVWKRMTTRQKWQANRGFLKELVQRRDKIRLATPLHKVKPSSYYEKELAFLRRNGYRVSNNGQWMTRKK